MAMYTLNCTTSSSASKTMPPEKTRPQATDFCSFMFVSNIVLEYWKILILHRLSHGRGCGPQTNSDSEPLSLPLLPIRVRDWHKRSYWPKEPFLSYTAKMNLVRHQGSLIRLATLLLAAAVSAGITETETTNPAKNTMTNTPHQMHIAILYDDAFLLHQTGPGHPERPDRLKAAIARIRTDETLSTHTIWPAFGPASLEAIKAVHTPAYVQLAKKETAAVQPGEFAQLSTGDTMLSADTWNAALLAAGAAMAGVDAVIQDQHPAAFALVRPPGHHATPDRGMGFCLFNNIAIAARHAQREHNIERVLIVDIDVHHGNGTQDIFYEDNSVFFFCVHQHPLYPGTGRPRETGRGPGKGYTQNVDLPRGAGNQEMLAALQDKLAPAMESFQPQLILVSAGFDGHAADPLGGLRYTTEGFAKMAVALQALAQQHADGRIVFVLEGGYNTSAMADSITTMLHTLLPSH